MKTTNSPFLKKLGFLLLLGFAFTGGFIGRAHAQIINFSTTYYAGIPAKFKDSNETWWNSPLPWPSSGSTSGGSVSNAVDSNGIDTGVKLTVDNRFSSYFNTGPTTSQLGYATQISKNGVYIDSSFPTAVLTLSGLDPNIVYDLTFYAAVGANGNSAQDRRLLIDLAGATAETQQALNVLSSATTPSEATVSFSSVAPDALGEIRITLSYPTYPGLNRGHLNAITLTAIPEPTSFALILGGLGSLAIIRKRR